MDFRYLFRDRRLILSTTLLNATNKRNAVDVAYKIHGPSISETKRHILVLHGLLGSKRNWESMCTTIASNLKATVIAADARNHGDSPHHRLHTYKELAEDASKLITKLSLNAVHIIGHSMGGRTAMYLALTEPSKVISLVPVDISPITKYKNENAMLTGFFPKLIKVMNTATTKFSEAKNINQARTIAGEFFVASGIADKPKDLYFILMNINQRPDKKFGWKCNLVALSSHFKDIMQFPDEMLSKQYGGPTLFIAGDESSFIPKSHEPSIKKMFPQAELVYIDKAGHNVHVDQPSAFLTTYHNFFSRLPNF